MKKAFRSLSLKLHPDKNNEPDAEVKFRQLVSISEVLKDEKKRKSYDEILLNGLPDWKTGIYYFRRARKLGLLEMTVIVSLVLTVGHYLCLVAAFYEKSFEVSEVIKKKSKKLSPEEFEVLRKETMINFGAREPNLFMDNLVVKTSFFLYYLIIHFIPATILLCVKFVRDTIQEKRNSSIVVEEEEVIQPKVKKRVRPELPDFTGHDDDDESNAKNDDSEDDSSQQSQFKSDEWTDEEIHSLIKLTKKFPGGTSQRWERIATLLGRSVDDVTKMSKKINAGQVKASETLLEAKKTQEVVISDVSLRDDGVSVNPAANWSQEEQILLEKALLKYPKGTDERWDKIALQLEGRSKVRILSQISNPFFIPIHFVHRKSVLIFSSHFIYRKSVWLGSNLSLIWSGRKRLLPKADIRSTTLVFGGQSSAVTIGISSPFLACSMNRCL